MAGWAEVCCAVFTGLLLLWLLLLSLKLAQQLGHVLRC
jgi:hypothetical protein